MTQPSHTRSGYRSPESTPSLSWLGAGAQAHAILAAVVELVTGGRRLTVGEVSDEVLDGYDVRFGRVSDERRVELLTYVEWANRRRPFEALQIILPDSSGRWPDDPEYDAYPQPLLA